MIIKDGNDNGNDNDDINAAIIMRSSGNTPTLRNIMIFHTIIIFLIVFIKLTMITTIKGYEKLLTLKNIMFTHSRQ